MKKIYLDMQPTWKNKTGIGWYTYNIALNLLNNKQKYNIRGGFFNPFGIEKKIEKIEGLNYKEIKYFWPYYNYAGFFSKKLFKWKYVNFNKITNTNHDIYHFFNFTIPHNIQGKVVVTIHDIIYKMMPETVSFDKEWFHKEIEYSLNRGDAIITVSNSAKNDILKNFDINNSSKIKVVEPGINLKDYKKIYNKIELNFFRKKLKLDDKSEILLYLGTVEKRKNVLNIIKAFNIYKAKYKNKKAELVIVGKPGLEYNQILEEYNKSPYKDNIKLLGYITEEEKMKLYKIASIFLFPSLYEGFGMPVIEAMAAGVPVVTSNTSSLPEAAGNAGILINPSSVDELFLSIEILLSNKNLRTKLIEEGYRHVQNFTWEISAKKIQQIYDEL